MSVAINGIVRKNITFIIQYQPQLSKYIGKLSMDKIIPIQIMIFNIVNNVFCIPNLLKNKNRLIISILIFCRD